MHNSISTLWCCYFSVSTGSTRASSTTFLGRYKWSGDDRVWGKKINKYKSKRTVVRLTQGCLVLLQQCVCVWCWSVRRCVAVVFWSHVLLLFQLRHGSSPPCSPDSCLDSSSCLSDTLSSTRWAHVATRTNTNNTTPSSSHVQVVLFVFLGQNHINI